MIKIESGVAVIKKYLQLRKIIKSDVIEFNSDFAVTSDARSNVFIAGGLSGPPNE